MTSREIFKAVLTFDHPPRIGMALPEPHPNDLLILSRRSAPPEPLEPRGGELRRWRDEWSVTWASLTRFDKGEVVAPAIADWADLDDYRPPDLGRAEDYRRAARKFAEDTDHFRVGALPGFTFNIARKLRKLENYLCDIILEPDKVGRLNELVRGELLKAIDRWAEAGADAVFFPEDWGTQDRLMIDPALWRRLFRREFEILAGHARARGLFVIMHSCGKMTDIIADLIDCGIHCLQFDQPRLHGIDTLAERFGGKVTFWCPVDIQTTLQSRDPEKITREAQLLVRRLGAAGGGFVAGYYWGNEAIGLDPDVQDVACRAFVACGDYR
ncbi:MAG: hypothetical protein J7M21_06495 [Planctomycetes bacterium]|nr:hypothetical protein [Planctomycetota bacterium]